MTRLSKYSQETCFDIRVHNAMNVSAIGLKLDIALGIETFDI